MFPRSLFLVPAALLGYAALAIPGIGFLLAIFGGLYIPPLLLNLAVVGTAAEVWIGTAGRSWLLLPLLWFGGSAALAGVDRWQISEAQKRTQQQNAAAAIAFNPAQDALLFNTDEQAHAFVQRYQVGSVYAGNSNGAFAYHIGDQRECERLRKTHDEKTYVFGLLDPDSHRFGGRLVKGHCIIKQSGPGQTAAFRVESGEPKTTAASGSSLIVHRQVRIVSPSGQVAVLESGWAEPMPFIPFPMFGCYPNGGTSACEGTLGLRARVSLAKDEPVAVALNVKRIDWRELEASDVAHRFSVPPKEVIAAELTKLDRMIADPDRNNEDVDFEGLKQAPLSFSDRAPALIAAIEKSYSSITAAKSGSSLVSLAAALPDEQWRRYGPRLLALYSRSNWHWIREDDDLLARFGELGSPATAILVEEYQGRRGAALVGMCTAGSSARAAAPDLLQRVSNPGNRFVNARAEIITLARMGLYDQAMAANERRGRFKIPLAAFRDLPRQPGFEWCTKLSMT